VEQYAVLYWQNTELVVPSDVPHPQYIHTSHAHAQKPVTIPLSSFTDPSTTDMPLRFSNFSMKNLVFQSIYISYPNLTKIKAKIQVLDNDSPTQSQKYT